VDNQIDRNFHHDKQEQADDRLAHLDKEESSGYQGNVGDEYAPIMTFSHRKSRGKRNTSQSQASTPTSGSKFAPINNAIESLGVIRLRPSR